MAAQRSRTAAVFTHSTAATPSQTEADMATPIHVRKDTAAHWASTTDIPEAGEPCYDTTNFILKFGDGATLWASLPGITLGAGGGFQPLDSDLTAIAALSTTATGRS